MFRIDDSLGFILNRAAAAMRAALEARLAEYGLTPPQWAVLVRLWEEDGRPPSVLGESLGSDRATATGVIDRLEQKGLVRKVRDVQDRRVVRVYLTAAGEALRKRLPPVAESVNAAATKGMKRAEIAALKESLRRIGENLRG